MNDRIDFKELHWLLTVTQSIDVGVVVLDQEYRVQVWNTFMENRSGILSYEAATRSFFSLFPEINERWLKNKIDSVITLGTPAFTIWEQRPFLVRFKSYQPITGQEDFMYQNTTMFPLRSTTGVVTHVCLVIYDVTDVATNRLQLQAANRELQKLSSTDRLTSLYNRGHWEEALRLEHARHVRYGTTAALVMFDIDHFKRVNDTYGHQCGDRVIQRVADVVREHIRDADIAGRYGGEEFAVLLPDTDKQGGAMFAERLRAAVEALDVMQEGEAIHCTISLGVADMTSPMDDYKMLIERADQALYESKKNGRNRVSVDVSD
ncbi:diguanylate cyclase [Pseudomonas sp. NPDC078416]|uniref:sensor domain-containing diguanylate cyclase n=1 Tax=Pseudomonas sp. NPDC078416 TaxID=3390637 RepID=UPI003CFEC52B